MQDERRKELNNNKRWESGGTKYLREVREDRLIYALCTDNGWDIYTYMRNCLCQCTRESKCPREMVEAEKIYEYIMFSRLTRESKHFKTDPDKDFFFFCFCKF